MSPPLSTLFGGEKPPTHLDSTETAVPTETASPPSVDAETPDALKWPFRHTGWKPARQRTYAALLRVAANPRRLHAFANCATGSWILRKRDDHDRYKIVPDFCHDRFCVPCQATRQANIRRNLATHLRDEPHRFLTLTIRHHGEPLLTLVDRLYKAFRKLRQRQLWKDRVRGGAAFLELTYNQQHGSWNPHLHCMLEGSYIDRPELSRLWLACTGDSTNLDLRYIRTTRDVINYVTKYATKPLPPSVVDAPDLIDEAIRALTGRRMLITFGRWRNWRLLDNPDDQSWELFEHLNAVRFRATDGDPLCENIIAMLNTADPHSGEFTVHYEAPEPDD